MILEREIQDEYFGKFADLFHFILGKLSGLYCQWDDLSSHVFLTTSIRTIRMTLGSLASSK